jgi:hypothetical protein
MSRRCLNPGCYQGDPGDPPEFESDNAVVCFDCGAEIDLDDDQFTEGSDSDYYCEDCTPEEDDDNESE